MKVLLLAAVLQGGMADIEGARRPSVSADGRIAVSVRGDLWVVSPGGREARRLTMGPAWDRDPVWTPDGTALVYASDRAGTMDLWRTGVDPTGAAAVQLTSSTATDTEPAVLPDGRIAFVRGVSAAADIWILEPDGTETRLTNRAGSDRSPAASSTGALAWIEDGADGLAVRVRREDGPGRVIASDLTPIGLAWSPDGLLLAIGSAGRATAGVWVAPSDGAYLMPASTTAGTPAWSPDGEWLYIAQADGPDVGYNGDPDRLAGRTGGDVLSGTGDLVRVRAPRPPDEGMSRVAGPFSVARESLNADAFDRIWERTARLYLGWRGESDDSARTPGLRDWRDAARRHRAAALVAMSANELDDAIDRLLADRPALRREAAGRAAVSSAHPLATAAGVEILEAGGNVVDAAVAVSFALGVVEPDASGPGGYGEMLIQLDGMAEPTTIEFMTKVPLEATPDNPSLRELPADGPMRANVPGTIAGMEMAWRNYGSGRVAWSRLLEPAIRIAEQGYVLDDAFATTLRREWQAFAQYESSRRLFFRDGRPLQEGDTLRNPDLASTLRQVADGGADAFYRGAVARTLVEDLRAGGSPISLEDMARYTAAERRPVHTTYRGNAVYSGPPPVTGGVGLIAKLNLLEQTGAGEAVASDPAKLHAMIEAWKFQPSTGGRIGDPDVMDVDVTPFENKDTARARWACFDPVRASDGLPDDVRDCVSSSGARSRDGAAAPARLAGPGPLAAALPTGLRPAGGASANGLVAARSGIDPGAGDADHAAGLYPCIADGDPRTCRSTGTTAFAVADRDGNMVAVTQTLGTWGGNFYVTPGLGFLYNDKLVTPRAGGRGGSRPGARVGTVIAPTLIYRGDGPDRRPLMALGAAGNAWITSAVYEIAVGVLDHGLGPADALEQPRFLAGGRGGPIQIEDAFPQATIRQLEAMGHEFRRISMRGELRMGYGAAVLVGDGRAVAGADPRRSGAAGAVR
jgi:gamma-glutamyltranspeptidase